MRCVKSVAMGWQRHVFNPSTVQRLTLGLSAPVLGLLVEQAWRSAPPIALWQAWGLTVGRRNCGQVTRSLRVVTKHNLACPTARPASLCLHVPFWLKSSGGLETKWFEAE